jgi:hypothetical protein
VSIELEPNELRALLEKRRILEEHEVFFDTLFDATAIVSIRLAAVRGRQR